MNKNAIQKFAVWARTEMIAQVSQRAYQYGITKESYGVENAVTVNGRALSTDEQRQRAELVQQIKIKGYDQVMEEVAYTWFNRFIALRYMEVNNYLPSHIRVFSDANGAFKPEILADVLHLELDGLDKQKVAAYIEQNQTDDLYRYLLLTQCNALNAALPRMFERLGSYTELLLPNNILKADGILGRLVSDIPEEDWHDQVQIIGWLYQYYNEERKEETYALLKKNVKVTKERIPSATQLFTPDWIVRYMVENSLGRLVISGQCAADSETERIEKEKAFAEKMGWKYYLPEAEQEPDVRAQIQKLSTDPQLLTTIKVIDPCMGSGHILVYAFDVLIQIYEANGISQRDAAQQILKNNLYGLDIDDRAAQLAYFAVMMKARQYDRRIFTRGIQPHLHALQNSQPMHEEGWAYFESEEPLARRLWQSFADAKTLGSLVPVDLTLDELAKLRNRLAEMDAASTMGSLSAQAYVGQILDTFAPLVELAEILTQKYDVVITNPPYMGSSNMDKTLSDFVKKHYPDSKSDLFAVFIERCKEMVKKNGYQAMITQHAWMFLSSYEKLRKKLLQIDTINMAHLGPRAFDEIGGEVVQTTSFVLQNCHVPKRKGTYARLIDYKSESEKEQAFLSTDHCPLFTIDQSNFSKIPGSPVAYWVSEKIINIFIDNLLLSKYGNAVEGIKTGDNDLLLRLWYEVERNKAMLTEENSGNSYWRAMTKGGTYRKWYGNFEYVVAWGNDGVRLKSFRKASIPNSELFFSPALTWTYITSGKFSMRTARDYFLYNNKGPALYLDQKIKLYILGYLNTCIVEEILNFLAPTIDCKPGNIEKIPVKIMSSKVTEISDIVNSAVEISKIDWDSSENSWDFQQDPIVRYNRDLWNATAVGATMNAYYDGVKQQFHSPMELAYLRWKGECNQRFRELKKNEEELNRIFIDIYGLQDELTPDVADKDVTVYCVYDTKEDVPETLNGSNYVLTKRDVVVNFISYAVGCMLGRYSLNVEGLAYAGGEFSDQWVVVGDRLFKREVVEYFVSEELSRSCGMAEVDGSGGADLSAGEIAAAGGVVFTFRSNAQSSGVSAFEYRRGASEKIYEGIRELSLDRQRFECGVTDTTYDLCSPEILDAIASGNSHELVKRGWKDAERVDWQTIHSTLITNYFSPDKDDIIPICDDEYFDDDITGRFVQWVEVVYGKETLEENLTFIADALGGKGTSREIIRNYFLKDFYSDHCKKYKKRPIYWLFDSGKKNGFKALIYMHRYQPDLLARMRTDYVHEQQERYRTQLAHIDEAIQQASSSERVKLTKRQKKLQDQSLEIQKYEEKIHHLADQNIVIDLDDGVKHNYALFADVLAKI